MSEQLFCFRQHTWQIRGSHCSHLLVACILAEFLVFTFHSIWFHHPFLYWFCSIVLLACWVCWKISFILIPSCYSQNQLWLQNRSSQCSTNVHIIFKLLLFHPVFISMVLGCLSLINIWLTQLLCSSPCMSGPSWSCRKCCFASLEMIWLNGMLCDCGLSMLYESFIATADRPY